MISIENEQQMREKKYIGKPIQGHDTTTNRVFLSSELPPLPSEFIDLSRPDDTRSDQLLDLAPDDGVLHVVLERGRVGLSLLQDRLHDWVAHDLLCR